MKNKIIAGIVFSILLFNLMLVGVSAEDVEIDTSKYNFFDDLMYKLKKIGLFTAAGQNRECSGDADYTIGEVLGYQSTSSLLNSAGCSVALFNVFDIDWHFLGEYRSEDIGGFHISSEDIGNEDYPAIIEVYCCPYEACNSNQDCINMDEGTNCNIGYGSCYEAAPTHSTNLINCISENWVSSGTAEFGDERFCFDSSDNNYLDRNGGEHCRDSSYSSVNDGTWCEDDISPQCSFGSCEDISVSCNPGVDCPTKCGSDGYTYECLPPHLGSCWGKLGLCSEPCAGTYGECTTLNQKKCEGNSVVTCKLTGGNKCWIQTNICSSSQTCLNGDCVGGDKSCKELGGECKIANCGTGFEKYGATGYEECRFYQICCVPEGGAVTPTTTDGDGKVVPGDGEGDGGELSCKEEQEVFYSNGEATIHKKDNYVIIEKESTTSGSIIDSSKIDEAIPGFSNKYFENIKTACCDDLEPEFMDEKRVETESGHTWLWVWGGSEKSIITYSQYRCVEAGEAGFCLEFAHTLLNPYTKFDDCQTNTIVMLLLFLISLVVLMRLGGGK